MVQASGAIGSTADDVKAPARTSIQFYYRGQIVEVSDVSPTLTVLEWLREAARRTGTKEGCAEGDCGACTVIVAELPSPDATNPADPSGKNLIGGLLVRPINACIKFLPTMDGCALFTVEDLKNLSGESEVHRSEWLHPVQQAIVDCHASQCGFCTPGFVMSLAATYERHSEAGTRPTRAQLADDIAGNLCRCTGYRPILDAGERMFDLPTARLQTAPVIEALKKINEKPLTRYMGAGSQFWAPRSLEKFAEIRAAQPLARLLSGSTDIGIWVNKQMKDVGDLIYIGGVDELKRIEENEGSLLIGAATSLENAWLALVARWPHLRDLWLRFASPPIRHAGTLGGNIANGSPIGDGAPVLMSLGASVILRQDKVARVLPLEKFYIDYMKNALRPGEFLQALQIPLPRGDQAARAYKISKRYDSDISAVCAALLIEFDQDRTIKSARFAFGGMAATAARAAGAEAAVVGRRWDRVALRAAQAAVERDFLPISDLRASAEYRRFAARGLLERYWLETCERTGELPLKPEEATVFAAIQH